MNTPASSGSRFLLTTAAAAALAVQITTAQGTVSGGVTIAQTPMTHVVQPGAAPAPGEAIATAEANIPTPSLSAAVSPGLTIVPTFGSTITSDPNAAAIESAINTAIANIQSQFSDPITVNITFERNSSGLGQSSTYFGVLSYATFLAALKGDAKTTDDATAVALLPNVAGNPVNGNTAINVKTANLRAVGISASGPGGLDGTITLNTTITSPGSPGSSLAYNLVPVVEHEIDEVLGLGSSLPSVPNATIFPEDLYRYSAVNTRSFTTADSRLSGVFAYFSIDATTALAEFDNQNDGGDFGDWQSLNRRAGVPPKVQDAFATAGSNPAMSVELTALDVIGYDRVAPAVAPSITSQPSGQTIAAGSTAMMSVTATGTASLTYQWYLGTSGSTGSPIGGATSSTFTTPALTITSSYWVRVSNGAGTADSNTATITVITPPLITSQPSDQAIRPGQTAMFAVAAGGTAPGFQWQISTNGGGSWSNLSNGAPYSGVTTATLTVSGVTAGANGLRYRCVASNMAGSAASNAALLTVLRGDARRDYDGDGTSEVGVYRPSTGTWFILQSNSSFTTYFSSSWGTDADIPVAGDYDGDGKTDLAVYRPSTGAWWILQSGSNYTTYSSTSWGTVMDIPVPGDYDGDGKTDLAVYRPSTGTWWILLSGSNYSTYTSTAWGAAMDIPVPGDYDGDGKTDLAIYRPSTGTWRILNSSSNYSTFSSTSWGTDMDIPVPGDYDGDGKTDLAVYRPSTGTWWVLDTGSNYSTYSSTSWGTGTDLPVPGDFDGDGKTDLAVYRPSTGTWWILRSNSNYTTFFNASWGASTDMPLP